MRLEIFENSFDPKGKSDKVLTADLKKRIAWEIDYGPKTYKTFELNDDLMKDLGNPMELLTRQGDKNAELSEKQAELIGDETLDGRNVHVYRLLPGEFKLQQWKIERGDVAKVWVDAQNDLPVKIEGDFAEMSGEKNIHALYDHFQWNKEIDGKVFKLEVPKGFRQDEKAGSLDTLPIFVQMVNKLKNITSASFRITDQIGSDSLCEERYYLQGDHYRIDIYGESLGPQANSGGHAPAPMESSAIINGNAELYLDYRTKKYQQLDLSAGKTDQLKQSPIEMLRTLAPHDSEPVRQEEIDGHKTLVYRVKNLNGLFRKTIEEGGKAMIWIDVDTNLPVQVTLETSANVQSDPNLKRLFIINGFQWNESFDPKLFDVPEGFTKEKSE